MISNAGDDDADEGKLSADVFKNYFVLDVIDGSGNFLFYTNCSSFLYLELYNKKQDPICTINYDVLHPSEARNIPDLNKLVIKDQDGIVIRTLALQKSESNDGDEIDLQFGNDINIDTINASFKIVV